MVMQGANPSGQPANPQQQKNIEEERKKLDEDLKAGKISQAEYFKKMQELQGSPGMPPNPMLNPPGAPMPGMAPTPPGLPQLPPASGMPIGQPGIPQQLGPKEEVPPIGQALAVSSEDVEVVECYKCGGLITITTKQRPVIIACPSCGTKGEVDASEPDLAPEEPAAPKPTDAQELDEKKVFKFDHEAEKPKTPVFGTSLDTDLAKEDVKKPGQPTPSPTPQPQPQVKQPQPNPAAGTGPTLKPQLVKKVEESE
jgi:hypothetical protein